MFSNLLLLPQSLLLSLLLHDVTPVLGDLSAYSNNQKQPDTDPVIALNYDTIFVSWNGATDVDRWMLELGVATTALGYEDIPWEIVSKTKKAGFETAIKVPKEARTFLRVVAYNEAGKALGATETIKLERQVCCYPTRGPTSNTNYGCTANRSCRRYRLDRAQDHFYLLVQLRCGAQERPPFPRILCLVDDLRNSLCMGRRRVAKAQKAERIYDAFEGRSLGTSFHSIPCISHYITAATASHYSVQ
jgi:hypothetical protein